MYEYTTEADLVDHYAAVAKRLRVGREKEPAKAVPVPRTVEIVAAPPTVPIPAPLAPVPEISEVDAPLERYARIEEIQRAAARHFNVSRDDIISSRRTRDVVRPRQVAMYLSKMLTPRSLPQIGRHFGNRDHTTVLWAVQKMSRLLQTDPQLASDISVIRKLIAGAR